MGESLNQKDFSVFFTMVQQELDNDYLARVEEQIKALYFKKKAFYLVHNWEKETRV